MTLLLGFIFRSDFVSLPFQGVEVLLDNVIPLGEQKDLPYGKLMSINDKKMKVIIWGYAAGLMIVFIDNRTQPICSLFKANVNEKI